MKKKIIIKNEKDLKKFYRLLPIYKSFICRFVKFDTIDDKYDISLIISLLNIKNRWKRITCIYDESCNYIDNFYGNKNVCGFKNCKCIMQRIKQSGINGCCRICRYQSNMGCTTKNLICKLFMCSKVKEKYDILEFEDLKILKLFSLRQRLLLKSEYFSKREDIIMDLYIGSLLIGTFRIFYRLIITLVCIRRRKYE